MALCRSRNVRDDSAMTRDEKTASSSGGVPLRVLVVFGSKRGGTAGLGEDDR